MFANGCATKERVTFRPISLDLSGEVTALEQGEPPACPACCGPLDLSQPNAQSAGDELIGSCMDCDRLSYVIDICGSMVVAVLLPTRAEIGACVVGVLHDR